MKGLYAIVDTQLLARRRTDPIAYARAVLEARPAALQLRAKDMAARSFLGLLRELGPLCRVAQVPLVANDRADLATLGGCQMVHIGQEDLPYELVHRIAPHLRVGISTHNGAQLARALDALGSSAAASPPSAPAPTKSAHPKSAAPCVSYVAFGPVFATASKDNPDPVVGMDGLKEASALARAAQIPLVAIGGITLARAAEIAPFVECCAVIGDLFPENASLSEVTERARGFQAVFGITPEPISSPFPSSRSLPSAKGAA